MSIFTIVGIRTVVLQFLFSEFFATDLCVSEIVQLYFLVINRLVGLQYSTLVATRYKKPRVIIPADRSGRINKSKF